MSTISEACVSGDYATVLECLDQGVDPDTKDRMFGASTLFYATLAQNAELIYLLCQKGAKTINDDSHEFKMPPLFYVIKMVMNKRLKH